MKTLIKCLLRWFNCHPVWRTVSVRVWGHRLRAPTFDRWLALFLHRTAMMGATDRAFLKSRIRPGMTVVDIGANQGLYSLLFSSLAGGGGRVLAFEPDDMLFAALAANIAANAASNIRTFHFALGSQSGTKTLFRSLLNSGDNRLAQNARSETTREAVEIRVERLDQLLATETVDFIKMDVQGWEMEVFRGMERLLAAPNCHAMSIYFEYWPKGLRDAGTEATEPLEFLARHGFAVYQPNGQKGEQRIQDFAAFASSIKGNAYLNLYAVR